MKGTRLGFTFGNVVDVMDCKKNSIDKCIEGQCTVRRCGCNFKVFSFHVTSDYSLVFGL